MKKLNRKGFTLIELLAIIVILAIIMVVTFPNILDAIATSRQKTFANSANSIADWIEDQYAFANLGQLASDSPFVKVCPGTDYCKSGKELTTITADNDNGKFLKAAGVVPTNYSSVKISFVGGRACVSVSNIKDKGDFAGIGASTELGITVDATTGVATVKSNGC